MIELKYDHLLGRKFEHGITDCYSLMRDFYKDNFGLELTNYARADDWWYHGQNLYIENFRKEGFEVYNGLPMHMQPGDAFLMAIRSDVANHAGALVDNSKMLHHLFGMLSTAEPYNRPLFRDTTVAVLRHPAVTAAQQGTVGNTTNIEALEILPDAVRRKVEEALNSGTGARGLHPNQQEDSRSPEHL